MPLVPVSREDRPGHRRPDRDDPARRRPPGAEGQPEARRRRHGRRGRARQGPRPGRDRARPDRHAEGRRHRRRRRDLRPRPGPRERAAASASRRPARRAVVVLGLSEVPERGRHPARRPRREDGPRDGRGAQGRGAPGQGRRPAAPRSRTSTARSRPARPRSCASSSRPTSRARSAPSPTRSSSSDRRGPDQRPPRGRRRHHRQRHPARVGVERDRGRLQHQESPTRPGATAEAEGVDVRLYDIIYKLTDDMEAALKGLLEPEIVEVVEGRAEVRQIFRVGQTRSSPAPT